MNTKPWVRYSKTGRVTMLYAFEWRTLDVIAHDQRTTIHTLRKRIRDFDAYHQMIQRLPSPALTGPFKPTWLPFLRFYDLGFRRIYQVWHRGFFLDIEHVAALEHMDFRALAERCERLKDRKSAILQDVVQTGDRSAPKYTASMLAEAEAYLAKNRL